VTAALELTGISKRFGPTVALDGANLTVERGTVHALLGENGAGKTTLMRIAFGLVKPESGTIRLDGEDVAPTGPADAIRRGLGMVHQHPTHVLAMTALENLELGNTGPFHRSAARAAAAKHLERVGFSIDLDEPVANLPVAAQQRLEILKAISRNARLLILDEPTAILAPSEARELLLWLRRFAAGGGTAIVITHKLEEARGSADDLTILRAGRTVFTAKAAGTSIADLTTAMIGSSASGTPSPVDPITDTGEPVLAADRIAIASDRGDTVVVDATLSVRAGQILGVIGVEGSGHHELLLALAGRLPIVSGSLRLPSRIGFVPEDRHRDAGVLSFTLTENVAIEGAGDRRGLLAWKSLDERTRDIVQRFDVRTPGSDATLDALSGGNQQKLVLGREISSDPELLVLENPTRGLDIRATTFVHEQILDARAQGRAVILYSSDLDEVISLADRVIAMHAGRAREVPRDRAAAGAAMLGVQ